MYVCMYVYDQYLTLGNRARIGGSSCMARMKASEPSVKLTPDRIISNQLALNLKGERVESSSPSISGK